MKKVDELGSSNSFAAPDAAWPGDGWWRAYGDPQLDALIEEALHNAPDLDLPRRASRPRPRRFRARATRFPEVTASAEIAEAKQSYNYLVPRRPCPGLERLRRRHAQYVL